MLFLCEHALDGKSSCKIVVENDDRVQLAFIVQQLIFIEYPLEKVDILLKKEEKDADKTKRFMNKVNELLDGCENAILRLADMRKQVQAEPDDNPTKEERIKDIDDALASCTSIRFQILKSIDIELKFAVAASKKAGKSVIVNCFIGEQIAPTSTELATPNNCLYKKSKDNLYHLLIDGGSRQDFDTRQEIYDVINNHFRAAQNNKEDGFALPDMHIDYVTEENNFSSYTIFDTAGPDAAGTVHNDVAEKAMQRCDVAVFAIDYAKHLTTSEEDYLHRVKEMFTAQNKFHSLIFALNKIDIRYTDTESPKSFVMSVDFLKTRLANIDEAYRDCIIFPTCSLEYFSAIEAEKAGVTELNAENNLPIGEMKRVKFAHRNVPALAWLHTHSENLEYYHGIQTISYDVFKKDSGMPALMSYVSYVAQSKARDEIVNNVTFEIASQKMKIQSILDYIANIEKLINSDDEKINEISDIITDYTSSVEKILSSNFNQDDLNELDKNSLLRSLGGDYKNLIDRQRETLKDACNKKVVANEMYYAMVEAIWKKIKNANEINGNQIDKLFSTRDFKLVANQIAKQRVEKAAEETFQQLSRLSQEVKKIVERRQGLLSQESENCRERLSKAHISLELPEQPEFEFATKMIPPSEVIVQVGAIDFNLYEKLSVLFEKKFWGNIGTFFRNIFGNATKKDYKLSFNASKQDFFETCKQKLEDPFIRAVLVESDVVEKLTAELEKSVIDGYMKSLVEELKQVFESMNFTYKQYIKRFSSAVDDRDKYKKEIDSYNQRKANILSIGESTNEFMDTWNMIVQGFIEDEQTKKILLRIEKGIDAKWS